MDYTVVAEVGPKDKTLTPIMLLTNFYAIHCGFLHPLLCKFDKLRVDSIIPKDEIPAYTLAASDSDLCLPVCACGSEPLTAAMQS